MATTLSCPKKAKAAANKQKKKEFRCYLSDNYQPHEQDVLIGRGRLVENHKGNHRFKALIQAHLVAYYNAQTKATKTTIILRIFQDIKRTAQADGGAGFIKRESSSKRWFVIEDSAARISIAQAFRDALASEYKSSKQYKQQKRKEQGRVCLQAQANMIMCSLGGNANAPQGLEAGTLAEFYLSNLDGSAPFGNGMTLGNAGGSILDSLKAQEEEPKFNAMLPPPPPPLVPMVSSDGRDLSHRLRGILNTVSNVVADDEGEHDLLSSTATAGPMTFPQANGPMTFPQGNGDSGLLSSLYSAIGGSNMDMTIDPFEPTPLAVEPKKLQQGGSFSKDLDWGGTMLTGGMSEASLVVNMIKVPSSSHSHQEEQPKKEQPQSPQLPSSSSSDDFQIFDSTPLSDIRAALSA
ncbi:Nitrilase family, member 2 [Seminavis robusta]|uniref:Nitrilase family, member 2 n=1 Tax=Seminavis robusta TaxID=568900 RepID=A0A9N8F2K1_9STRA|nr:Nitrilase family, member 2 [Seminavis robusta]|eukprot:Sro2749_g336210.1 Nitrilase family, member 2 (407) ;mRNA; r:6021-7334